MYQHKEALLSFLIIGSLVVDALLLSILSVHYILTNETYVISLFFLGVASLAYLTICGLALRLGRTQLVTKLLHTFYYGTALCVSLLLGLSSPISLLLFCFFILIGGVLMGSTQIVKTTSVSILSIYILQTLNEIGIELRPNTAASISETTAYSILFAVFAVVGWIGASQIEKALAESLQAKAEILRQKNLLDQALASEEYRRQQLQIDELQNLYQFAELGQQTTLLFHEFANQLTTLSMDIEELTPVSRHHAQQTVTDMNRTMQTVREKLSSEGYEVVSVARVLDDVIKQHKAKLKSANIKLTYIAKLEASQAATYGDTMKFRQIMNILIDNAIQAYEVKAVTHQLKIVLTVVEATIQIDIIDYGIGITSEQRQRLFKPSHTTKVGGHGIGLYIAKRIIESQFKGNLRLDPETKYTKFTVTVPRIT